MRTWIFLAVVSLLVLSGCGKKEEAAIKAPSGASEVPSEVAPSTGALNKYCDELQRLVSEADCTLARELVVRADAGIGAFNAPSPIKRGETVLIQLVLAMAPPPAPVETSRDVELRNAPVDKTLRHGAPSPHPTPAQTVDSLPGETVEFTPIVGRHMAAELSGEGFDIVAKSPREQDVLPQSQTSWEWLVTPQVKGLHTLTLKTFVEAEFSNHKRFALRSLTTNKTIEVTVTPMGIVSDFVDAAIIWLKKTENLLKAVAGLVAAAVALWFTLRKRA